MNKIESAVMLLGLIFRGKCVLLELALFAEKKERYGNEFIWITKSKSLLK